MCWVTSDCQQTQIIQERGCAKEPSVLLAIAVLHSPHCLSVGILTAKQGALHFESTEWQGANETFP